MTGQPIVVFGAGGHGKVVADAARSAGFVLAAFVDDAPARAGSSPPGVARGRARSLTSVRGSAAHDVR